MPSLHHSLSVCKSSKQKPKELPWNTETSLKQHFPGKDILLENIRLVIHSHFFPFDVLTNSKSPYNLQSDHKTDKWNSPKNGKFSTSVSSMNASRKNASKFTLGFFTIWHIKLLINYHDLGIPSMAQLLMHCYIKNCWRWEFFSCFIIINFTETLRCVQSAPGDSFALLPTRTETMNRRKIRIFCGRRRQRTNRQVKHPGLGSKIMSRVIQSQQPEKRADRGIQPNSGVGPLGSKNWTPTSSEEQVIGKGGRKQQQMGGGGGVEEQKCN